MATEDFEDGMSSSTLLVYFSAARGLSSQEGNGYLRPARYTPILSRLIYCTRLIFLEAILPRRAHPHAGFAARPRYGQLAALNAIRVNHMCDGTLSPLGEFFSLLAYGMSLQRSEGPAYHFDWSEDGQTISWDGNIQLSMGQFRGLAHEAFRQATIQCQRLMYGFEPEDPDIGGLRDRLSKTTPGYSFLTDPQNRLEELYLTVFMRACTAPVDGLLKTQQRDSGSSWDIDAAQAYLYGHDAYLKTIIVLGQLDSGQGARVSELLTIEQANTRSRLRGIGIFGGKMLSITRHHKARLTTNHEFQVARFFSPQVATLLYKYLVYIRPTAYAILRRCFGHEPQSALIFMPISKNTRWTTRVFTEELKRLSRDVLGTDLEIDVQLYRQLSIAITERHVRGALPTFNRFDDVTAAADPDVAFAWQSGHRPKQRYTNYGLDGAYPDKLQPSLLRIYASCSERWHKFLSIRPEVPCTGDIILFYTESHTIILTYTAGQDISPKKRQQSPMHTIDQPGSKRQRLERNMDESMEVMLSSPISIPSPSNAANSTSLAVCRDKYHKPEPPKIQSYGIFIHLAEFDLLICRTCQCAVFADEVPTHLRRPRHMNNFTASERRELVSGIDQVPGLLRSQDAKLNVKRPPVDSQPVPFIKPPQQDGLGCNLCAYVVRADRRMKEHYRKRHQWVNDWKRGAAIIKVQSVHGGKMLLASTSFFTVQVGAGLKYAVHRRKQYELNIYIN
ncbi:hypothetical protein FOXYSP1_20092 [Fusarium oxysporum f. sp. phaseoli]